MSVTARGEWGPAAPALAPQENSLGSCCWGVELGIPCLQGFMEKPRGLLVLQTAPVALGMSPLCPQELVLEPSTGTGATLTCSSPSQGCSGQSGKDLLPRGDRDTLGTASGQSHVGVVSPPHLQPQPHAVVTVAGRGGRAGQGWEELL